MKIFDFYKEKKLRFQFLIISILLLILPVIIYFLFSYNSYYDNIKATLETSLEDVFVRNLDRVNEQFNAIENSSTKAFYSRTQQTHLSSVSRDEFYKDFLIVQSNFDLLISMTPCIKSIYFYGSNGFLYYSSNALDESGIRSIVDSLKNNDLYHKGKSIYVNIDDKDYFLMIKKIRNVGENYFDELGTTVMWIDRNYINSIVNTNEINQTYFEILDKDGKYLVESKFSNANQDKSSHYIVKSSKMDLADLNFVGYISTEQLNKLRVVWFETSVFVIFITVLFIGIILVLISFSLMKPMDQLANAFKAFGETGRVKKFKKSKFNNEVTNILEMFNDVVEKNKNLTKKIFNTQSELYEAEIRKTALELTSLQTQISSHFLYNILSSIRAMILKSDSGRAVEMIQNLYNFLRYITIRNEFVTIEEELFHVKNYMELQNVRQDRKFTYKIEIDESTKECKIPKLIIQPLVENAIIHGFSKETIVKSIHIKCYVNEQSLKIKVMDTGMGIDKEKINQILSQAENGQKLEESIALANIFQRIKLNDKKSDINISSKQNVGTVITLTIPLDGGESGVYSINSR